MATLLSASSDPCFIEPANGRTFTLQELQTLVGGDIETVRTDLQLPEAGRFDTLILVINEHGKHHDLPLNRWATALAVLGRGDHIVGDAVLCTPTELGEDDGPTDTK